LHKLLLRQLRRHLGEEAAALPELQNLLQSVSDAYHQADEDRALIERSMEVVSEEMLDRYHALEAGRAQIHNVTQAKLAAEETAAALARSERRYRRVLESGSEAIWIIGSDGATQYVNQQACGMFGLPRETLLRESLTNFVADEKRAAVSEMLQRRRSGESDLDETVLVRADGSIIFVLLSVTAIEEDDSSEVGTMVVLTDISERKRSEQSLRESEAKLLQAQKMEAVGRFAGSIAHDFNNILTAILGYTDFILLEVDEGDPMRDDLEQIRIAAQRATALTRQILTFSKGHPTQKRVLDAGDVIVRMEGVLQRLIGAKSTLVLALSPRPTPIKIDQSQLEQLILNLVVNANDALVDGGSVTVETAIETLAEDLRHAHGTIPPGRYVRLSVTDTGVGITPQVMEQLFEPFFTTKHAAHGTGLGLSTVRNVVRDNWGFARVQTEIGRGSTFHIYFPLSGEMRRNLSPLFVPRADTGTETILVVDDEESVRTLASRILKKYGYTVIEAKHGRDALLRAARHEGAIDMILTDVVMPEMDGPALVREARISLPDAKIIMMSGYAMSELEPVTFPGDVVLLHKPFDAAVLLRTVREVLDSPGENLPGRGG
jgi:two-component system, cell cycle sensor histidine kinase and response regulator CckA